VSPFVFDCILRGSIGVDIYSYVCDSIGVYGHVRIAQTSLFILFQPPLNYLDVNFVIIQRCGEFFGKARRFVDEQRRLFVTSCRIAAPCFWGPCLRS
jgi:hypothetical protein